MLKADNLSYSRDGRQIFSGINFDVKNGTCLFIEGQNGSGKTTLLRLLAGLLPMREGTLIFNGSNISANHDLIAQNIDYIGHVNATKDQMTAWDNLILWNSLYEPDQRIDLTSKFGDPMLINDFKNKPISFCSAGQIRRVALSRLSTSKKKIWLLDEPMASLDKNALSGLENMIGKHCLNGGIAIITTHDNIGIPKIKSKSIKLKQSISTPKSINADPFLDGEW